MNKKIIFGIGLLLTIIILGATGCSTFKHNKEWFLSGDIEVLFDRAPNDPPGKDDKKVLKVVYPSGESFEHYFGENHAGYTKVELRIDSEARYVWLVDKSSPNKYRLGPAFDLVDKIFFDEGEVPQFLTIDGGTKVNE